MRQSRAYRFGMITLALIIGSIVYLFGIAAMGITLAQYMSDLSSPLSSYFSIVTIFAFGLGVLVTVLTYSVILHLSFGSPLRWRRVAILSSVMILLNFFISWLVDKSIVSGISPWPAILFLPLIWFGGGLFIVRDWVVRPDEQRKLNDLIKDFE